MPKTMSAAVVKGFGQALAIETLDAPGPKRGRVLIKPPPFVLGHQGVGRVVLDFGDSAVSEHG